jgi:hypothetical protein
MIWHSKHPIFDRIKENSIFWENRMFQFAKPNNPVFGRCTVQQSILLNQVQQNRMFQFLKPEGPNFLGSRTKQAK